MTRALAWAPKCNCRTCRIRRMDSLSVGIPSPPSIATGERWSQVNTDLRNDLRSRRPSLPPGGGRDQIGRVAAIRSVGWPPSGWNTWPPWIGIHITLLERAVEGGVSLLAPLLELEERDAEFAGEEFHALAAQQAQDDLALARDAPALAGRQRAGLRRAWRRRGSEARGQRGRAAPARADHRPINRIRTIDLVHVRLYH